MIYRLTFWVIINIDSDWVHTYMLFTLGISYNCYDTQTLGWMLSCLVCMYFIVQHILHTEAHMYPDNVYTYYIS